MEGAFEEAFTKAGLFSGEILPVDIQFLAALRNQAESALNKKGHSASMAAHALIGMIDGRTFRDGPLTDWLESITARMRAPKTAAKAIERLPQGQFVRADAAVPLSASEATSILPQGQIRVATEAEPNTVPAEAAAAVPQGHNRDAVAAPPQI